MVATARALATQQHDRLVDDPFAAPLVRAVDGQKLSKQNGAQALDTRTQQTALVALNQAALYLGLPARDASGPTDIPAALAAWVSQWRATLRESPLHR